VLQRDRFYAGKQGGVYDRMLMLELAGLYNRQVLLIAISGTADATTCEATRDAVGVEWETKHLVRFDAATTEYDVIASGGRADETVETIVIAYPHPFDDEVFEAAWQTSGAAPPPEEARDEAKKVDAR
jgi:hypothetical protein